MIHCSYIVALKYFSYTSGIQSTPNRLVVLTGCISTGAYKYLSIYRSTFLSLSVFKPSGQWRESLFFFIFARPGRQKIPEACRATLIVARGNLHRVAVAEKSAYALKLNDRTGRPNAGVRCTRTADSQVDLFERGFWAT